jgi:NhaP-type Na+/H+ or K+/H+ antiporter
LFTAELVYLIVGLALLLAVLTPTVFERYAVSAPMVLLLVGMAAGLLPAADKVIGGPLDHLTFLEHLTEFTMVVALMGVGLAIDRPLMWRSVASWRRWGAAWRLLALAMPLTIAGVALLGWSVLGLGAASALLLGAVLAPTDPVLASEVQVEGPTAVAKQKDVEHIDEEDEVRFALTSEAGLNDGMAFPFVYAAMFLVTMGAVTSWGPRWLVWELGLKPVLGALIGTAVGWLLAKLAFRAPYRTLRLAETGEPLLALAAVLLSYGAAEIAQTYGFLAVFACAMTLRAAERGHDYHVHMHQSIERLERLLTLTVLLLLGAALTERLAGALTWQGALVGVALVFGIRPLAGLIAFSLGRGRPWLGDQLLTRPQELAVSWFGIRGVGSLYYLAYATRRAGFEDLEQLWATVAFTIALSVLAHGVTATPVMKRLEEARSR